MLLRFWLANMPPGYKRDTILITDNMDSDLDETAHKDLRWPAFKALVDGTEGSYMGSDDACVCEIPRYCSSRPRGLVGNI